VARRTGFHILTAGMAEQEAFSNAEKTHSLFTQYFVDGILGAADFADRADGYVSLSELVVFVRYNVAKATGGAQTPMLGRIGGYGEMLFKRKLDK
jgi:hypothetical protein